MSDNISIIIAFLLYLLFMMAIGVYFYYRTHNMSDYILGGRKLGAWVTSMSAEAFRYEWLDAHGSSRICLPCWS